MLLRYAAPHDVSTRLVKVNETLLKMSIQPLLNHVDANVRADSLAISLSKQQWLRPIRKHPAPSTKHHERTLLPSMVDKSATLPTTTKRLSPYFVSAPLQPRFSPSLSTTLTLFIHSFWCCSFYSTKCPTLPALCTRPRFVAYTCPFRPSKDNHGGIVQDHRRNANPIQRDLMGP